MRHDRAALGGTLLLWALIFFAFLFIQLPISKQKNEKFGTISIRLEALPAKKTPTKTFAPALELPVKQPDTKSALNTAASKTPSIAKTSAPSEKTAHSRSSDLAARTTAVQDQVLYKSTEQLMAEQAASPAKAAAKWDESLFIDKLPSVSTASETVKTNSAAQVAIPKTSFSGTAAQAVPAKEDSVYAASLGSSFAPVEESASGATKDALDKIGKVQFSKAAGSSEVFAETEDTGTSSNLGGGDIFDKLVISFADGKSRKLIEPKEPVLSISKENEKLIDSSRKLSVEFTVLEDGNVKLSSIRFIPSALLPPPIQLELSHQLLTWRFEPALTYGQASFTYVINKR